MSDAIHSTNDPPLTPILKRHTPPIKPKIEQLDPITRRHGSLTGPQLLTAFYTGLDQAISHSYPESVRTFRRAYLKMVHPEHPGQETHNRIFVDTESSRSPATPNKQVHFSSETEQDVFASTSEQHGLTSGGTDSAEPQEHPYFSLGTIDKPLKQSQVKGEAFAVESMKTLFSKGRDSLKKTKVAEIFRGVKKRVSPKQKAADEEEQEDYTLHNVSNEIPLLNITSPDKTGQASAPVNEESLTSPSRDVPDQPHQFAVEAIPKNETAIALVNRLSKARLAFNVGFLKLQQSSYEEATLWLHKATRSDPRLAMAWFALGNAYAALSKWRHAITALRYALSLADWEPWTYEYVPSTNPYVRQKSVLPRNNVLHNAHLARQHAWWIEMVATYKQAIPVMEQVLKQGQLSPAHYRHVQAKLDEYLSFHRRYLAAEPSTRDKYYPSRERPFVVPWETFLAPPKELEEMYPDHVPGKGLRMIEVDDVARYSGAMAELWKEEERRRGRAREKTEKWLAGLPEEMEESLVPAPLFAKREVEEGREMFPHARVGEWRKRKGEEEGDCCFVVEEDEDDDDVFMEEARRSLLL